MIKAPVSVIVSDDDVRRAHAAWIVALGKLPVGVEVLMTTEQAQTALRAAIEAVAAQTKPAAREEDVRPIEATWTDGQTHAYVNLSAALSAEGKPWRQKLGLRVAAFRYLDVEPLTPREEAPEGAAGEASAYRVRMISNDPAEWVLMHPEKALDFLSRKGWESQPLYAHPSPTPAADDDRLREVLKLGWGCAMTVACNIAIDEQNRANDDDAASEILNAQGEIIRRIKGVLDIDDGYMAEALAALKAEPGHLPTEVQKLVIAARLVAYEDKSPDAIKELDAAVEAFAGRVPWDHDPNDEGVEP